VSRSTKALPGGVNQGMIDPATWKYGPAFDAPPNTGIWNPVKLKMMRGEKVTGGTFFGSTDPVTYCAMANAGYDFIWTEMQHGSRCEDSKPRGPFHSCRQFSIHFFSRAPCTWWMRPPGHDFKLRRGHRDGVAAAGIANMREV